MNMINPEMKLLLNNEQNVFFTSDTHYNHPNICSGTTKWTEGGTRRDFSSVEHMNNTIVNNINNMVGQDDILFHLGDWSFGGFDSIGEFRDRIVCKNIHLILGNHDHHIARNKGGVQDLFSSVQYYLPLTTVKPGEKRNDKHIKTRFVLFHCPIASWSGIGDYVIHLHGHLHSNEHSKFHPGKAMDAGLDGNNLDPYRLREIISHMRGRPRVGIRLGLDHHEANLANL